MTWFEKIKAVHLAVTNRVGHRKHLKGDRYFVWQEDGVYGFYAGGKRYEHAVTGTTDLYTKLEYDPWVDAFEAALNAAEDIVWDMESIQYEPETGYTHYEWAWEVL